MDMKDMSHSSEEIKNIATAEVAKPEYPYGLKINLGPKELEKLDIMKAPEVGAFFYIKGKVEVVSVEKDESQSSGEGLRVCLQIKEMAMHDKDADKAEKPKGETEQVMYGE